MSNNKLQVLLDRLATAARSLSEEEVEAVVKGRARILLRIEDPRTSKGVQAKQHVLRVTELQDAAFALRRMSSREEGAAYLNANFANRSDLLNLARVLDIPIGSRDPRTRMEEKIIDATIGFRLRSDAIRNRTK